MVTQALVRSFWNRQLKVPGGMRAHHAEKEAGEHSAGHDEALISMPKTPIEKRMACPSRMVRPRNGRDQHPERTGEQRLEEAPADASYPRVWRVPISRTRLANAAMVFNPPRSPRPRSESQSGSPSARSVVEARERREVVVFRDRGDLEVEPSCREAPTGPESPRFW